MEGETVPYDASQWLLASPDVFAKTALEWLARPVEQSLSRVLRIAVTPELVYCFDTFSHGGKETLRAFARTNSKRKTYRRSSTFPQPSRYVSQNRVNYFSSFHFKEIDDETNFRHDRE